MAGPRIKGQEVFISILSDGQLQARIDSIQSCDIEFELDLLEENYLGETATRYDSIFNGVAVTIEGHATNTQSLDLTEAIIARAQRRTGGAVRIDVAGSFKFPNGDFPTIAIVDVFFESVPISTGAREEFVSFTLTGKASEFKII
jgi:hypothetical protein